MEPRSAGRIRTKATKSLSLHTAKSVPSLREKRENPNEVISLNEFLEQSRLKKKIGNNRHKTRSVPLAAFFPPHVKSDIDRAQQHLVGARTSVSSFQMPVMENSWTEKPKRGGIWHKETVHEEEVMEVKEMEVPNFSSKSPKLKAFKLSPKPRNDLPQLSDIVKPERSSSRRGLPMPLPLETNMVAEKRPGVLKANSAPLIAKVDVQKPEPRRPSTREVSASFKPESVIVETAVEIRHVRQVALQPQKRTIAKPVDIYADEDLGSPITPIAPKAVQTKPESPTVVVSRYDEVPKSAASKAEKTFRLSAALKTVESRFARPQSAARPQTAISEKLFPRLSELYDNENMPLPASSSPNASTIVPSSPMTQYDSPVSPKSVPLSASKMAQVEGVLFKPWRKKTRAQSVDIKDERPQSVPLSNRLSLDLKTTFERVRTKSVPDLRVDFEKRKTLDFPMESDGISIRTTTPSSVSTNSERNSINSLINLHRRIMEADRNELEKERLEDFNALLALSTAYLKSNEVKIIDRLVAEEKKRMPTPTEIPSTPLTVAAVAHAESFQKVKARVTRLSQIAPRKSTRRPPTAPAAPSPSISPISTSSMPAGLTEGTKGISIPSLRSKRGQSRLSKLIDASFPLPPRRVTTARPATTDPGSARKRSLSLSLSLSPFIPASPGTPTTPRISLAMPKFRPRNPALRGKSNN